MTSPASSRDTVSVIIPVFDRADLIDEAVDSALAQTHDAIDIVIVDDGSTDGTAEVVDRRAATDPRITVLHQPNRGPSAARNAGIAVARGTWLAFLDSDDLMHPERVAAQLAALRSVDRPAICIGQQFIEIAEGVTPPAKILAELSTPPPRWCPTSMLVRRDVVDAIGGFDEDLRLGEDTDLLMRLRRTGVDMIKEQRAITIRRIFGDNLVNEIVSSESLMIDLLRRNRPRPD